MLTPRRTGLVGVLVLGLVTACGKGPTDLQVATQNVTGAELPGDYLATTFTTDSAGVVVDHVAQNATIMLHLSPDGRTSGFIFVPDPGVEAGYFHAELAGTFSFDDSTGRVSFDQPADTFVRDMSFTAAHRQGTVQLEGRQSFRGTVVHVVLGPRGTWTCTRAAARVRRSEADPCCPSRSTLTAGILALGRLAACGDGVGPQGVTRAELFGDYMATTFTTDSAWVTVDRLSQGARHYLALDPAACVAVGGPCLADGSMVGQLFMPGGAADGSDFDADLSGTFPFDERTGRVSFDQPVDTCVRDLTFTGRRRNGKVQLEARRSLGGTVIHVVLRQSVPQDGWVPMTLEPVRGPRS